MVQCMECEPVELGHDLEPHALPVERCGSKPSCDFFPDRLCLSCHSSHECEPLLGAVGMML